MILFKGSYIAFVICVILAYYTIFRRAQWTLLLAASLFFYVYFTKSYFIFFSIIDIYLFSLLIHKIENKGLKKAAVTTCLLFNFSFLFLIKYTPLLSNRFNLLIPLGISFYMFQSISYIMDLYWGRVEIEKNPLKLALFISYFPQVIQGPIGRFDALMPQLLENKAYDSDNLRYGFETICWGAFKKIFIADHLGLLVNTVFDSYGSYPGLFVFLTVFAYSIQIYADFSGGIDIVRGISQILGIDMAVNFRRPFFSRSLADFWRRWHISLGTWMKDYVFYPLNLSRPLVFVNKKAKKHFGRKRGKLISICLSTYILYFIVGIWHGAGTNYVLYGLWNGTIISFSLYLEGTYKKTLAKLGIDPKARAYTLFQIVRTNLLVTLGRYFSRASGALVALKMWAHTFKNFHLGSAPLYLLHEMGYTNSELIVLFISIFLVFLVDLAFERGVNLYKSFDEASTPVQLGVIGAFALAFVVFVVYAGGYVPTEFIYRQY